jgi:enoyl-CoA hydratase/carnithine racemase
MYQLADIVDGLSSNQNNDLTCLVIRGVGDDAFCSGASFDLVKNVVNNPLKGKMMAEFMTDCLNRIRQSGLISICYINGPALGGGAELTTVADFRIINSKARIQFVHAKLGVYYNNYNKNNNNNY